MVQIYRLHLIKTKKVYKMTELQESENNFSQLEIKPTFLEDEVKGIKSTRSVQLIFDIPQRNGYTLFKDSKTINRPFGAIATCMIKAINLMFVNKNGDLKERPLTNFYIDPYIVRYTQDKVEIGIKALLRDENGEDHWKGQVSVQVLLFW